MAPIKPGDRFFRVRNHGRGRADTDWIVVTKVGNRWAIFKTETGLSGARSQKLRFDMETLYLDSGNSGNFSSPGRVYRTEEEYRTKVRVSALWIEFRRLVDKSHTIPLGGSPDLTEIAILKAADVLGFRLKGE